MAQAPDRPQAAAAPPQAGWPDERSPYHDGEQAVQARAGVRERAERAGRRMIRDFMPDQHRELFEKLPFLVVGGLDEGDRVWASLLVGRPGFVATPDARTLVADAKPLPGDPLAASLAPGAPIGILGIELPTRRRNRMNGTVIDRPGGGLAVRVGQSFGNCAQYIQARHGEPLATPSSPRAGGTEGPLLSDRASGLVRRADTFFIATAAASARSGDAVSGVDVSHRGGRPGFVRLETDGAESVLTAPDFPGNSAFNTFGNLAVNPGAGLLFIDFESGDALLLHGRAEIVWDGPELAAFAGARRLLTFHVETGSWICGAVPTGWSAPEPAPQLAATGSWDEVAARLGS